MEYGISEDEYYWVLTPAQLMRRFRAMDKQKETRMWETGYFTRLLLNIQGCKFKDTYDILPFDKPEQKQLDVKAFEDNQNYAKNMMLIRKMRAGKDNIRDGKQIKL